MSPDALRLLASDWMRQDPDPVTRAATERLLASGDDEALVAHFGARLQFGTAGLRGEMGPGPNRMNRVLVRRVTAGLADYLLRHAEDAPSRGVVIAYDGRIDSDVFARDAAAVLVARGFQVHLAPTMVPTPYCSFSVVELGAAAGIMVTASHNPPQDNGYKVYWSDGAQIVPPHDQGISDAIDAVDEVGPLPTEVQLAAQVHMIPASTERRYFDRIAALRVHRTGTARVVYTAMHGVGRDFVIKALTEAGHLEVHQVAEQVEPDGRFPTVAFPNPEEPGAMDLALAKARAVGADVVIANDPDADRLAVALPTASGEYRVLTGNQVGLLLASDLLEHGVGEGRPMVATTIVSTAMLKRLAAAHGAAYAETLTGFKWIANQAMQHDARGGRFVFGFEEALGYSAGSVVRDKDGVSAALLFVDLVAATKAGGQTVWDLLERLYRTHGLYLGGQHSVKLPGASGQARIQEVLEGLRQRPPGSLGGVEVEAERDLTRGTGRRRDGTPLVIDLPQSDVLAYDLVDGSRVLVRPSGTEPKLKLYFEVREVVGEGESIEAAERRARERLERLKVDLLARTGLG
jgi:phosphomannomutase